MSHSMPGASEGPGRHQAIDKYRYPLKFHLKGMSRIPHSRPSVRSLKHQTLFPSVAENFRERQSKDKEALDPHSVKSAKRFGGHVDDDDNMASFQDEIVKIHVNEKLKALNDRSGSCIPNSSVDAVVVDMELEKAGRLRKAYDKVQ